MKQTDTVSRTSSSSTTVQPQIEEESSNNTSTTTTKILSSNCNQTTYGIASVWMMVLILMVYIYINCTNELNGQYKIDSIVSRNSC